MSSPTGRDVLNVLFKLKKPASLNEIVGHLSSNNEGSNTALLKATAAILDAGVRFDFILEEDNKYRAEYMFPDDELRIQLRSSDEKTNIKSSKEFDRKIAVSSDEDELNDHEDDCGPRLRRRKRSRSRSTKRRSSRRRRRHG